MGWGSYFLHQSQLLMSVHFERKKKSQGAHPNAHVEVLRSLRVQKKSHESSLSNGVEFRSPPHSNAAYVDAKL